MTKISFDGLRVCSVKSHFMEFYEELGQAMIFSLIYTAREFNVAKAEEMLRKVS